RAALAAGGVRSAEGRAEIDRMDRAVRDARHLANPGAAADLTAAAIFVVLLGGGWQAPPGPAAHGGRDAASRRVQRLGRAGPRPLRVRAPHHLPRAAVRGAP